MKFIAIKDINEYEKMIVDIFKQLSGNSVTNKVRDGFIFIYLDYENNEELENVLNAFEKYALICSDFSPFTNDFNSFPIRFINDGFFSGSMTGHISAMRTGNVLGYLKQACFKSS